MERFIWLFVSLIFLSSVVVGDLYTFDSDIIVTDLSKENFAQRIFTTPELWLVQFYKTHDCDQCKRFVNEYTAVADNIGGIVNIAAVDCEEQVELCSVFKLNTFPMLLLFPSNPEPIPDRPNQYIKNPTVYQGAGTAGAINHWVIKNLPDEVTVISDDTLDVFLSSDLPKVLLFSEKAKPANLFKSLSLTFKNTLSFGMVKNTEANTVQKYNINKFPSIIVITSDSVSRYDGPISKNELKEFIMPFASDFMNRRNSKPKEDLKTQKTEPIVPELHQVNNQEEFDKACKPHGLCFIVFMDPSDESHGNYISLLETIVNKYPSFAIIWIDGTLHQFFKQGFKLPDGFPQAVLLQRKKMKYRIFTGAMEEELIDEYFEIALSGKGRTALLTKIPSFDAPKEDL
jgi:protein disulfide-isomerase A6